MPIDLVAYGSVFSYRDLMSWKAFFTTLIVVPALDYIWLGMIMSGFYGARMTEVGRYADGSIQPIYWAAAVVYFLLALGMSIFVAPFIQGTDSRWKAIFVSGLFGLIVYGVYDFTNYATLKAWPITLVLADMAWGGFVCALAGSICFYLRKFYF